MDYLIPIVDSAKMIDGKAGDLYEKASCSWKRIRSFMLSGNQIYELC